MDRGGILIINADDFGLSPEVNRAIVRSFQQRYCSSATMMANMPGFDEACQLAHDHKLIEHVGVHLVLTAGQPLSEPIRRCARFCDTDGRFCLSRGKPLWTLSRAERDAVACEFHAQIGRCREHGLPVTHLDSHHHIHSEWGVFSVLRQAAKEAAIPFIRLSRNAGPGIGAARRIYKRLLNARIRWAGKAGTRYFGSPLDLADLLRDPRHQSDGFEVMVHPSVAQDDSLVDAHLNVAMERVMAEIPGHARAISYGELAHGMCG